VREVRARVPDARVIYVDDALATLLAPHVLEAAVDAERVIAAVYVIPSGGRAAAGDTGSPALEHGPSMVLANVLKAANDKTVVVALGNPYLIAQYPAIRNYVCTFSNASVSELSAVKFLFGETAHFHRDGIELREIDPPFIDARMHAAQIGEVRRVIFFGAQ